MSGNKFNKLFNPNDESMHLSLIYFTYCDKVAKDEKQDLYDAYINASKIAEEREFKEADHGIYR